MEITHMQGIAYNPLEKLSQRILCSHCSGKKKFQISITTNSKNSIHIFFIILCKFSNRKLDDDNSEEAIGGAKGCENPR